MQRTLGIVKPLTNHHAKDILAIALAEGFRVTNLRKLTLQPASVREFYAEHWNKPWFEDLVDHMASGPVTIFVLEHEDAVAKWRKLIGSTDPSKADPDTIRWRFSREETGPRNVIHGSDSLESAEREIKFMFAGVNFGIIE